MLSLSKNGFSIHCAYDEGSHECTCGDDYCRCGTIEDARVERTAYNTFRFAVDLGIPATKVKVEDVIDYMYAKATFETNNFKVEIYPGYYGEELGPITYMGKDYYTHYNELSLTDKMNSALMAEYKIVLPQFTHIKNWELKKVPVSSVICKEPRLQGVVDEYRDLTRSCFQIPTEQLKYFAPVCLQNGINYTVYDGHHRFAAMKSVLTNHRNKDYFDVWILCPGE